MINILIIEKDINYCNKIINILNNNINLKFCIFLSFNKEVKKLMNEIKFTMVFIDDDLLTIHSNLLDNYKTHILIMTSNNTNNVFKTNYTYINKNNINKEISSIILKILNSSNIKEHNLMLEIKKELNFLGYNPKYYGTQYISEAIYILINNGFYNDKDNLEKYVYPAIAKKHNKSINTIKCNIINATDIMICECEEKRLKKYLGYYDFSKPGPKKIIESIISKICNRGSLKNK